MLDSTRSIGYLVRVGALASPVHLSLGRKKEKHVNKSVLAGMIAVAGLAAAANAQTTIEVRLVVDGEAGAPAGIPSYLPGAQATAVGLTLQARVRTATASNFGITGVASTNSSTLNRFSHNDTRSNGWTGGIQRGSVGATDIVGSNIFGAFNPFRQFIGAGITSNSANNWNAPNGNAVAGQTRFPGFTTTAAGTGVAASLPGTRTANGFQSQDANNRTQIQAIFLSVNTSIANVVDPNTGENTPGAGAPSAVAAGEFSAWSNLYRIVFVPAPNNGTELPNRQVTVNFSGVINFGSAFAFNETAGSWLLTSTAGRTITDASPVSATFTVPTPGAAALLGLGGLAAFRRRRSA
jgi:MYXO-CTERM domain-containing protein